VIEQDLSENQAKYVYLGLGSNLGNKKKNIEKAKFYLLQHDIRILKSSSYYESLSWPNPRNPKFLNIVLRVSTNLKPQVLLKKCKKIETDLGRKLSERNSPRICDIDVIDYDKKTIKNEIILPHPRMHIRNFVLFPLFEINKDWIHPISKLHIKRLILSLPNRDIRAIKQI
jgi:2-amino-4-hydroxy-6-hydroxymethyldihydropteridine diphosphokinase